MRTEVIELIPRAGQVSMLTADTSSCCNPRGHHIAVDLAVQQGAAASKPLTLVVVPEGSIQCRVHRHSQFPGLSNTAANPHWGPGGPMFSRLWAAVVHVQDYRASVQPQSWQVSARSLQSYMTA
jgi:hypothetical protein